MTTPVRSRLRRAAAILAAGGLLLAVPTPAQAAPHTVEQYQKWYLDLLHIPEAQKISRGDGIIVGVVDDSVSGHVAELKGRLLPGLGIGSDVEPDGTGDKPVHGTAMAAIIAGTGGKGRVLGVAPGARILPASSGIGHSEKEVVASIRWVADHGAKVINLSIGADRDPSPDEIAAVKYALDKDIVVVASAGNTEEKMTRTASLGRIPGVVVVTGVQQGGTFCGCSVTGPEAVLSAPAKDVIAPYPPGHGDEYSLGLGTSPSAALVSGIAAMIRSKYPDLNAPSVINRLIKTAVDKGPKGRDPKYGFGIVNAEAALTADIPPVTANPLGEPAAPESTTDPSLYEDVPFLSGTALLVIAVAGGAVAIALIAVVIIVVVTAKRRRRAAAASASASAAAAAAQQWHQPQPTAPWQPPRG